MVAAVSTWKFVMLEPVGRRVEWFKQCVSLADAW
jgi:hypothetical protein